MTEGKTEDLRIEMPCPMAHSLVGWRTHHFSKEHIKSKKESRRSLERPYGFQEQRKKTATCLTLSSVLHSMQHAATHTLALSFSKVSFCLLSLVRDRQYPVLEKPPEAEDPGWNLGFNNSVNQNQSELSILLLVQLIHL